MSSYERVTLTILRADAGDTYVTDEAEARQALVDVIPNSWDGSEIESAGFNGDWVVWVSEDLVGELSEDEQNEIVGLSYWVVFLDWN